MSDRAVQDDVIRYLADARVRARRPHAAPISAGEGTKATQFAHFLARRYYRDRLARSFRYSRRFRGQTGRIAEEVVDGEEFYRFLGHCVMGSIESARCVGEMAHAHLSRAPEPGPWWQDLLGYETAYFLQAATAERATSTGRPSHGISAVCRRFAWALPEMLPRLRAAETLDDDLRRQVTLLFSRTDTGRIYVVEIEATMEKVFHAVDGGSSLEQIATRAGTDLPSTKEALDALAGIGAVKIR